jgi:hypothetical protein
MEKNCASRWSFTKNHYMMHGQQNGKSEVRIPAGKVISPQNNPASIPWETGPFPHQQNCQSVRLTTTIYLVPMLRINGVGFTLS